RFPVLIVELGGIPGNGITVERIKELRDLLLSQIRKISEYPDHSDSLLEFNRLVETYAVNLHRSEVVWTRDAPGFGSARTGIDWKTHFECLEMDTSFIRSLSEEPTWQAIRAQLSSGTNIWRELIARFHLLDVPYAAATVPSP